MKKTTVRLSAVILSAALAAVAIRVLPDAFSAGTGIRADAAEAPLAVQISADPIVPRASEITVQVQIEGEIPWRSWIGVVPSWVAHTELDSDNYDSSWRYLADITDGTVTLNTPNAIGSYEIRCFNGDGEGAREIACIPFETTFRGNMGAKLSVENRYIVPGADVKISAELSGEVPEDAWISFIPSYAGHSEEESDAVNGNWKWAHEIADGSYVIQAPKEEGNYDIRIFDGDGNNAYSVACLPVYVTADEEPKGLYADLEAPDIVLRNAKIPIRIRMTGEFSDEAWISIVQSDVAHTEKDGDDHNGDWARLKDIQDGYLELNVPDKVGNYDIRVYDGEDENTANEIANLPFKVVYSTMRGTVSTDETWVKPGTEVTVRVNVTGEYPDDAWLAFVPSEIAHTEKDGDDHNGNWCRVKDIQDGVTKLYAPAAEGSFDVRLYDGEYEGAVEVAFCTLTVAKKAPVRSAFELIEAETANELHGEKINIADQSEDLHVIGYVSSGDYAVFESLDFGSGADHFSMLANASANTADGGTAELRLDSKDGTLIGSVNVPLTGKEQADWMNYYPFETRIEMTEGIHDLYLVFKNAGEKSVMNVDSFVFSNTGKTAVRSAFEPVSGMSFDDKKGTLKEDNYHVLGWTREGDWAVYRNLDFGNGASYFTVNGISSNTDSSIELRLDSPTGTLIGTCPLDVSGSYGNYIDYTVETAEVTGVHDLYLVFRSASGSECSQVNSFLFSAEAPQTEPAVTTEPPVTTVTEPVTTEPVQTTAPVQKVSRGDVNGDGSIDLKDVTVLRRYLAGGWNAVIVDANSDVNNDGSIDLKDVTVLRRYLAGGWGVTLE